VSAPFNKQIGVFLEIFFNDVRRGFKHQALIFRQETDKLRLLSYKNTAFTVIFRAHNKEKPFVKRGQYFCAFFVKKIVAGRMVNITGTT